MFAKQLQFIKCEEETSIFPAECNTFKHGADDSIIQEMAAHLLGSTVRIFKVNSRHSLFLKIYLVRIKNNDSK